MVSGYIIPPTKRPPSNPPTRGSAGYKETKDTIGTAYKGKRIFERDTSAQEKAVMIVIRVLHEHLDAIESQITTEYPRGRMIDYSVKSCRSVLEIFMSNLDIYLKGSVMKEDHENRKPNEKGIKSIEAIRRAMIECDQAIQEHVGDSREKSIALTKLEEARMWAVKGAVFQNTESVDEIV